MNAERIVRLALLASTAFNTGGGLAIAFPESWPGRLVGLPAAPPLYRALLGFVVLLFGGAYGWMARQPRLPRELTLLAALGKTGFFVIAAALWIGGHGPGRFVIAVTGDLLFALVFAWGLLVTRDPAR